MNNSIQIFLTDEEKRQAVEEGLRRQTVNRKNNIKGRNGGPTTGKKSLDIDILGAVGEMAVAKYMDMKKDLYKEKEPIRGSSDLLYDIDVKTRSKHYYDLIVQKNENPNKKYILVTIENKIILIHGWIYASKAMDKKYWSDPARGRPAYFFPKNKLNHIETLKDVCK